MISGKPPWITGSGCHPGLHPGLKSGAMNGCPCGTEVWSFDEPLRPIGTAILAPGFNPGWAGAGAALVEGLFQRLLPGLAGDEVPLVEERIESLRPELVGEELHGRLVGAGVAEEDVVAGHRGCFLQGAGFILEDVRGKRPLRAPARSPGFQPGVGG